MIAVTKYFFEQEIKPFKNSIVSKNKKSTIVMDKDFHNDSSKQSHKLYSKYVDNEIDKGFGFKRR